MRDNGYLVVWLLYMFYRYTVVLYTVTLLRSLHSTQTTKFWSYLCQKSCHCVFAASSKLSPEYAVQFLSNRAGKYRAWLQKNSQHLCCCCCCTKCWKTWRYSWENRRYNWVHHKVKREVSDTMSCFYYQKRVLKTKHLPVTNRGTPNYFLRFCPLFIFFQPPP